MRKEEYKEGGRECERYVTKKRENVLCKSIHIKRKTKRKRKKKKEF